MLVFHRCSRADPRRHDVREINAIDTGDRVVAIDARYGERAAGQWWHAGGRRVAESIDKYGQGYHGVVFNTMHDHTSQEGEPGKER